jgi:hypothetical protein
LPQVQPMKDDEMARMVIGLLADILTTLEAIDSKMEELADSREKDPEPPGWVNG